MSIFFTLLLLASMNVTSNNLAAIDTFGERLKTATMSDTSDKKAADLARDTYNAEDHKARLTADFGTRQSDTDHWLSVTSEDRQGPLTLEDPFAREKVRIQKGCGRS